MTYRQYDERAALRLDGALSRGERRLMLATLEDGIPPSCPPGAATSRTGASRPISAGSRTTIRGPPLVSSASATFSVSTRSTWARVLAAHSMGPYAATFPVRVKPEDRRDAPVS